MLAEDKLRWAKAAAQQFLQQLGPQAQAAAISFADTITLDQPLSRNRLATAAALDRAQVSGDATAFLDAVYWGITQVALRAQGPGSVIGASPVRADARRIVLALTDGNDNQSRTSSQQVIDYARANGVSLCTVALGGDANGQRSYLANQTGGTCLRAPSPQDLQHLYNTLAEQLRREYRVTIRSPRPDADGTRRDVRVQLAGSPLQGETWYQAPGQGSLLVTVPRGELPGAGAGVARNGQRMVWGALLMLLGLGGALTALFFWLGNRGRTLQITSPTPAWTCCRSGTGGNTRVGRGAECELVLDSSQVSRVHARIEAAEGLFRLVDERSRNGTFVNGERVRAARDLEYRGHRPLRGPGVPVRGRASGELTGSGCGSVAVGREPRRRGSGDRASPSTLSLAAPFRRASSALPGW